MKILAWYSAFTLSATLLLGVYGFLITKQTPLLAMSALLVLYCPPAVFIWLKIFNK
ncbi:MAG: hypothetical protein V2A72_06990 [Candidatus Omnitrophota bacterium]